MPDPDVVIEIIGEGKTDVGGAEGKVERPEHGVVPILTHKLCGRPDSMRVKCRRPPHLQGKKLWQKVQFAKLQAYNNGSAGMVFVVDTEGDHPRQLKELEKGRDSKLAEYPSAVGVAHPCIEAWLLTNDKAIIRALELRGRLRFRKNPSCYRPHARIESITPSSSLANAPDVRKHFRRGKQQESPSKSVIFTSFELDARPASHPSRSRLRSESSHCFPPARRIDLHHLDISGCGLHDEAASLAQRLRRPVRAFKPLSTHRSPLPPSSDFPNSRVQPPTIPPIVLWKGSPLFDNPLLTTNRPHRSLVNASLNSRNPANPPFPFVHNPGPTTSLRPGHVGPAVPANPLGTRKWLSLVSGPGHVGPAVPANPLPAIHCWPIQAILKGIRRTLDGPPPNPEAPGQNEPGKTHEGPRSPQTKRTQRQPSQSGSTLRPLPPKTPRQDEPGPQHVGPAVPADAGDSQRNPAHARWTTTQSRGAKTKRT